MTLSTDTADRLHARRDGVLLSSAPGGAHGHPLPGARAAAGAPAAAPGALPVATPLGTPVLGAGAAPRPAPAAAPARDPASAIPAASAAPAGAGAAAGGRAALQGIMQTGYELGEELGRGGLGQVNRAVQRVFGRNVAIKQLVDGAASERAVRKFFAEALVAAQLEHPNILPIHDLIIAPDGRLQSGDEARRGPALGQPAHPVQRA